MNVKRVVDIDVCLKKIRTGLGGEFEAAAVESVIRVMMGSGSPMVEFIYKDVSYWVGNPAHVLKSLACHRSLGRVAS